MEKKKVIGKNEPETGRVLILKNRSGRRLFANVCFDNKTGTIYLKEK